MRTANARRQRGRPRPGFTLVDLVSTLVLFLLFLAITFPALAGARRSSGVEVSLGNLAVLGAAHAAYAADWNGRQVTHIADDMSAFGSYPAPAFAAWAEYHGMDHPPSILGWGIDGEEASFRLYQYTQRPGDSANHAMVEPIAFDGFSKGFGSFRLPNTRALNEYTGGRFYDEIYYPPNDVVVRDVVEPALAAPDEFVYPLKGMPGMPAWSSYCLSPAAMFEPGVMRHPDDGGWRYPWFYDPAFRSPALAHARYANLKTFMLEHHWNQNAPRDLCNPGFVPGTYGGCEPWYFNHGRASAPATLFYDLSVRLLPNAEVEKADLRLIEQTGHGIWSRETWFWDGGYFNELAYDDLDVSHHVLTTEGILGRDTLASEPASIGP